MPNRLLQQLWSCCGRAVGSLALLPAVPGPTAPRSRSSRRAIGPLGAGQGAAGTPGGGPLQHGRQARGAARGSAGEREPRSPARPAVPRASARLLGGLRSAAVLCLLTGEAKWCFLKIDESEETLQLEEPEEVMYTAKQHYFSLECRECSIRLCSKTKPLQTSLYLL